LLNRQIIEFIPPTPEGAKLRVHVDLQDDFSMDQTLSLYLLETVPLLDPEHPDYTLDLLSLVESILENPEIILRRQLDEAKSRLIADLKAEGVEYMERMNRLDEVEYPKPNREFIYSTFNAFADRHPWVGQENIRPKSIVREMFEQFRTFSDYVRDYDLQRSEGLLLRHLSAVHKVLAQTVPDGVKTEAVRELEQYLQAMIRQVDSSLLEEWEKMRHPSAALPEPGAELRPPGGAEATDETEQPDVTQDTAKYTTAVRTRIFLFLRSWSIGDQEGALSQFDTLADGAGEDWTGERLDTARSAYLAEHERLSLNPEARNARHTYVQPHDDQKSWRIDQMLVDPAGHNDWVARFETDLAAARERRDVHLRLLFTGPLERAE